MMRMIMKSRRKEVDEDDKKKGVCVCVSDDHAALCLPVSTRGGQRLPN